ncbi:response regulator [Thermodesulfobacteriota bacterium]
MGAETLQGKYILAVDDEPDILAVIGEELDKFGVKLDTATTFEEARQRILSYTYDVVVLDIMGVQGFDLLELASSRNMPAVMLTAHALSPEALKKSIELGARAYVPKDEIDKIGPFLEDVLTLSYEGAWKSHLSKLAGYFGAQFGPDWRKSEKEFWADFEKNLDVKESTIIKS